MIKKQSKNSCIPGFVAGYIVASITFSTFWFSKSDFSVKLVASPLGSDNATEIGTAPPDSLYNSTNHFIPQAEEETTPKKFRSTKPLKTTASSIFTARDKH